MSWKGDLLVKKRKPPVKIEKGRCSICLSEGHVHEIVTGRVVEGGHWRLTEGCKATFGFGWKRVADPRERRKWVKKFWELEKEKGR